MTVVSFFAGMEGFGLAFERAGFKVVAHVEIDPNCLKLLAAKFPGATIITDIRAIPAVQRRIRRGKPVVNYEKWKSILELLTNADVFCGGFPCQDLSQAGLRTGLSGDRSGLWFTFRRIISIFRPAWHIIENVPGLLTSQSGDDANLILDQIENLGYALDIDILDAQFFGLAQRRRRVFICSQHRDDLLKRKTISSGLTVAQWLSEILLLSLADLSGPLSQEWETLAFDVTKPKNSLLKRMRLFSPERPGVVLTLAENLAALRASSGCVRDDLESPHGSTSPKPTDFSTTKPYQGQGLEPTEGRSKNTVELWSNILEGVFPISKECITSTAKRETIESRIYICAKASLNICQFINQSGHSSPNYWSAALSSLIALKEFINYARQASSDLFKGQEWVRNWHNFITEAVPVCVSLGSVGVECFEKVHPVSESVCWNPAPSRETGQAVAPTVGGCSNGGGANGPGRTVDDCESLVGFQNTGQGWWNESDTAQTVRDASAGGASHANLVGIPVTAKPIGGHHSRNDLDNDTYVSAVARSLRATGNDKHREDSQTYVQCASDAGALTAKGPTAMGAPEVDANHYVVSGYISPRALRNSDSANEFGIKDGQVHDCLQSDGSGAIAFSSKNSGNEISPTLRALNFKDSHMNGGGQIAIAFQERGRPEGRTVEVQPELAYSLNSPKGGGRTQENNVAIAFDTTQVTSKGNYSNPKPGEPCHPLAAGAHPPAIAFPANMSATQCAASEEVAPVLQSDNPTAVAFRAAGQDGFVPSEKSPPIAATDGGGAGVPTIWQSRIARNGRGQPEPICPTLNGSNAGATSDMRPLVATSTVRRLVPVECLRLQGFPDNYFDGLNFSDSVKYRMIGNSVAVPCVEFIARRLMATIKKQ